MRLSSPHRSVSDLTLDLAVFTLATGAAIICLLPFVHVIAVSLSSHSAASAGAVTFVPKEFSLASYQFVLRRVEFWRSLIVTVHRLALAVPISLLLLVLTAYPLSRRQETFSLRTPMVWVFFFTMLFTGGLIPRYLVVRSLGLIGTIWALVLPVGLNVFNMILLLNFFRQVPESLEEAAYIDGAGHVRILFQIFVPLSLPAIATLTLFTMVFHWNSWFDGLIYSTRPETYPLQTYLQSVIVQRDLSRVDLEEVELLSSVAGKTVKSAQVVVGALPILAAYPFLQRYFVKGIALGSVKG